MRSASPNQEVRPGIIADHEVSFDGDEEGSIETRTRAVDDLGHSKVHPRPAQIQS